MSTDEKTLGFVALLDRAIDILQERIRILKNGGTDVARLHDLEYLANGLSRYRTRALKGELPPSEGVVTIGVLREVGDWGEPLDSPLLKVAQEIEHYYLNELR